MPSIELNKKDIQAVESMLWYINNGGTKALVTATNKTANSAKTQWAKKIRQDLNLKAKRIKQDIVVKKASFQTIKAHTAVIRSTNPALVSFPGTFWNKSAGGVFAKPWKKQASWFIFGAFVETIKGNEQAIVREYRLKHGKQSGKKWTRGQFAKMPKKYQGPIRVLRGPSPYDAANYKPLIDPLTKDMGNLLETNLSKQADDLVRRAAL